MKAILREIIKEAENISSFRLEPEEELIYKPGQWMYVRLDDDLKHHFTISSSPTESFLQFTTKFRPESEYKQVLWKKRVGDVLEIHGGFGNFILDESDTTPRLFIAGGIGITPFRSMLQYRDDKNLALDIKVLYSVTNAEEAIFSLSEAKVIQTKSEGRLNRIKITDSCPDWAKRTWWISGPPAFVQAMVDIAHQLHLSPEQLHSEEFTGY